MSDPTSFLSHLRRCLSYGLSVLIGVFALIGLVFVIAFSVTYCTQPSDKSILMQAAPHDHDGKRVWRIPTKKHQKVLPDRKKV